MRNKVVWSCKRRQAERGAALVEIAITLPILLLISVGIFEFGRAYQHWQVITNAAREGARLASLPGADADNVRVRVREYMEDGRLPQFATADVAVDPALISTGTGTASASRVTVTYPFDFMVLNPVVRLVSPGSTLGASTLAMTASAQMRNENAF